MYPCVHVEALCEVRMMTLAVCPSSGARGGAATQRGDNCLHRPSKSPACHVGGVLTADIGFNARDCRDQSSLRHGVDQNSARAAVKSRPALRIIHLCEQRDQKNKRNYRGIVT